MSSEQDQEKPLSTDTKEPNITVDMNQIQNDNIDKSLKAINSYQSGSNGDSQGGKTLTNESEDQKSHSEKLSTGKRSPIEVSGQDLSGSPDSQKLNAEENIAPQSNNNGLENGDNNTLKEEDISEKDGSPRELSNGGSKSDEKLLNETEDSADSANKREVENEIGDKVNTEKSQTNVNEHDKSVEKEDSNTFITNLPADEYADNTTEEFGNKDKALDNDEREPRGQPENSEQNNTQTENTTQQDDFYDDPPQKTVQSEDSETKYKELTLESNTGGKEGGDRAEYLTTGQQNPTDVTDGNSGDVLNTNIASDPSEQKESVQAETSVSDREQDKSEKDQEETKISEREQEKSDKSSLKSVNKEETNISKESKAETKEETKQASKVSSESDAEGDQSSISYSTKQDDTLADVDPLETLAETPVKADKEGVESEMTKSEVERSTDDNARADDVSKRVINDDTDNEADDLKSEEVTQTKENNNNMEEVVQRESSETQNEPKDDSKHIGNDDDGSQKEVIDSTKTNEKTEQGENKEDEAVQRENGDEKEENEENDGEKKDKTPDDGEEPVTKEDVEQPVTHESPKEPEENQIVREPTPEPEPVKVFRNIDIDNAVTTIQDTEGPLKNLLSDMKELLTNYQDKLNSEMLSDFTKDLDKFRGDFASLKDAFHYSEELFHYFNKNLKEIRMLGDNLNSLIQKKFRMEDLTVWLESPEARMEEKDALMEERIAVEKSAMAKAADARAAIARAAVSVTESSLFAAEIEAEAAEAEAVSKRAWETAQNARRDVEEAEKAAVEKRKAEEEARKRAEERAQKKAEEERLRQAEENKRLQEEANKKGTSFEDEKRQFQEEKARKEAERKNPKNWPRYIYSVDSSTLEAGVPGCVIRAIEGSMKRDDVTVKAVDQLTGVLTLVENEELVSNIVSITPSDPEKKFQFEEPVSVAIPHCLQRNIPGREPVIKQLQPTGKWAELPTNDIVIEDMREMKFVEIRTKRFGVFAVVLRIKKDTLTFLRRGNKVNSSVDARISFTCKPGMVKNNVCFTSEVQALDVSTVTELNKRYPTECGSLLSSSPIVRFQIPNRKFAKPLTFTLPLPPNSTKLKRPQSVAPGSLNKDKGEHREQAAARPLSSIGFSTKEDEPEEEMHLLVREDRGPWTIQPNVELFQPKNKDIVTFDIKEPHDRFIILRTKQGISPLSVEKMASHVERAIHHRTMQVVLRQRSDDPNEVVLVCCPSSRTDKTIKILGEEGFDEGPPPSKDIIVKEGQILDIMFRGNIRCDEAEKISIVFNTFIRGRTEFNVEEIDKFAQKSFSFYRGFAQVFTTVHVQRPVVGADKTKAPQKPGAMELVEENVLLTELLINIPKPEPEPPKPLATAPIKVTAEGPNKEDILQYVASELGDEWKKLAQYLSLKSVRIQAILRQNNQNPEPKKIRYDMLVTWAKRVPRCLNKLEILAQALSACGRGDLAIDLRERDEEFRRRRALAFRDSYLRRAFVKIAQNPEAVKGWKTLATRLGVSEDDVTEIDQSAPSIQQKCFSSLQRWQSSAGEEATLPILSDKLRVCRYRQLARDIETIA